uniref:Uncharacterized protein n=1 Tax=Desertifilum tharense IPPAS B-1220 TaxID=1781255 RepID=A0ACD5GXA1_9CYAN
MLRLETSKANLFGTDPDWQDINNPDTSAVGFVRGEYFSPENNRYLDQFIQGLGDGSINLYQEPLNYQDGTPFVAAGQTATLQQIWYMPQLLEGIEGPSR